MLNANININYFIIMTDLDIYFGRNKIALFRALSANHIGPSMANDKFIFFQFSWVNIIFRLNVMSGGAIR